VLGLFITQHVKVYPVFKPNDYFWDHHWDPNSGEEKWETYARIIREEIIAPSFDFKLFDTTSEKKLEFKAIMQQREECMD